MYRSKNKKIQTRTTRSKKNIGKLIITYVITYIVLTCLAAAALASTAHAANEPNICFTVEQSIKHNGAEVTDSPKAAFTYTLSPKTDSAPMPEGCGSDGYTFLIEGAADLALLPIKFDTPGVFIYELSCTSKNSTDYKIDERVYTIEEHVTEDLYCSTIVYGEEGTKMSKLAFAHTYLNNINVPEVPENPKNPGNPTRPGSNNERPNTPQSPNNQGKPGKQTVLSSPSTGDFSNPALWVMIIAISCVLLLLIIYAERKLKEKHKKGRQEK